MKITQFMEINLYEFDEGTHNRITLQAPHPEQEDRHLSPKRTGALVAYTPFRQKHLNIVSAITFAYLHITYGPFCSDFISIIHTQTHRERDTFCILNTTTNLSKPYAPATHVLQWLDLGKLCAHVMRI